MKFRTLPNTNLKVSEVGFGVWTVATDWWGEKTDIEAIAMLHGTADQAEGVSAFLSGRTPQFQGK